MARIEISGQAPFVRLIALDLLALGRGLGAIGQDKPSLF
jgi:hypothetical protein